MSTMAATGAPPLWPDDALPFVPLPASGDDGFPQAFLLDAGGTVYRVTLAVTFTDPAPVLGAAGAGALLDLPDPEQGLFLNLTLEREDLPAPARLLGSRRVVPGIPIAVGPLCFRFDRITVAQPNLVAPGQFGSELVAEVAPRG